MAFGAKRRHNNRVPVQIVIDNRVRVDVTDLEDSVIAELKESFEHSNPQFHKLARLGLPTYTEKRIIKTWKEDQRWDRKWLTFPRGGLKRIGELLESLGHDRNYDDQRCEGAVSTVGIPDHKVEPWPHQTKLVDGARPLEQCILKAPTGSGKTTAGFALASALGVNTLVVVSSVALFKQWQERAKKELGLKPKEIGIVQGKHRRLKPLTIAMQKTLALHAAGDKEMLAYFGCVIADEVQLFAAKTFIDAIDPFPARYRYGISADHTRKDRKEFLLYDLFGGVGVEIKRRDLIESGFILDTEVRVIPTDFEAPWYGTDEPEESEDDPFAVFDPDGKSISRPEEEAPVERLQKELNFDRLLREMNDDPARNDLIVEWTSNAVKRDDEQTLVMSHRRDHCRLLDVLLARQGIKAGFLIGGPDYQKEFDQTRAAFEGGEIHVAVGTFQAIGYGIDLPKAAVVMATTPIAGNKQFFNQVRGRVCRIAKGKKTSWMYYFWDRHVYGVRHLKNLMRFNPGRVTVFEGGKWVDAKTYVKSLRSAA